MDNKDAYRRKIEGLLSEWENKIDTLLDKAEAATASARSHYYEQRQILDAKQEVIRRKLCELKEEGGEAWEEIKDGMEEAWKDLHGAFEKAAAKFSDPKSSEANSSDRDEEQSRK